jgi:hypothetical protein
MRLPKRIDPKVRDRLVIELAEHGIGYDQLPQDWYFMKFRDILALVKSSFDIPYCYRCQHLKFEHQMHSPDRNICSECVPGREGKWNNATLPPEVYKRFLEKQSQTEAAQHRRHVGASNLEEHRIPLAEPSVHDTILKILKGDKNG